MNILVSYKVLKECALSFRPLTSVSVGEERALEAPSCNINSKGQKVIDYLLQQHTDPLRHPASFKTRHFCSTPGKHLIIHLNLCILYILIYYLKKVGS